jgi:hypothetical protein
MIISGKYLLWDFDGTLARRPGEWGSTRRWTVAIEIVPAHVTGDPNLQNDRAVLLKFTRGRNQTP